MLPNKKVMLMLLCLVCVIFIAGCEDVKVSPFLSADVDEVIVLEDELGFTRYHELVELAESYGFERYTLTDEELGAIQVGVEEIEYTNSYNFFDDPDKFDDLGNYLLGSQTVEEGSFEQLFLEMMTPMFESIYEFEGVLLRELEFVGEYRVLLGKDAFKDENDIYIPVLTALRVDNIKIIDLEPYVEEVALSQVEGDEESQEFLKKKESLSEAYNRSLELYADNMGKCLVFQEDIIPVAFSEGLDGVLYANSSEIFTFIAKALESVELGEDIWDIEDDLYEDPEDWDWDLDEEWDEDWDWDLDEEWDDDWDWDYSWNWGYLDDMEVSSWARDVINEAYRDWFIGDIYEHQGITDLTVPITRDEFASLLRQIDYVIRDEHYYSVPEENPFVDIKDNFFKDDILTAHEAGLIDGISENEFGPGLSITREKVAVMIWDYLEKVEDGLDEKGEDYAKNLYHDHEDISEEAREAIYGIREKGLMVGTGEGFMPEQYISRQEAVVVLDRLFREN